MHQSNSSPSSVLRPSPGIRNSGCDFRKVIRPVHEEGLDFSTADKLRVGVVLASGVTLQKGAVRLADVRPARSASDVDCAPRAVGVRSGKAKSDEQRGDFRRDYATRDAPLLSVCLV